MIPKLYSKSSRSGGSGGNCVEWAIQPDAVYVRDSKDPDGIELAMTHTEWAELVVAARGDDQHPWITRGPWGASVTKGGATLTFTRAEWGAFTVAALAGECAPGTVRSR